MKTKRLRKLTSLIPKCAVLADVGCDHGFVGIEALSCGKAQQVIFVDISRASLDKARANCPDRLLSRARFECMDGLGQLQVDAAVIAGIGGMETISILSKAQRLPQTLVLQPNKDAAAVRRFVANNYEIVFDEKCFDGKFYDHIVAKFVGSPTTLTPLQAEFGKTNLTQPTDDFRLYLAKEQAQLKKILSDCNDSKVQQKLALVNEAIAAVGGIL